MGREGTQAGWLTVTGQDDHPLGPRQRELLHLWLGDDTHLVRDEVTQGTGHGQALHAQATHKQHTGNTQGTHRQHTCTTH
jgi:hypothetical protein